MSKTSQRRRARAIPAIVGALLAALFAVALAVGISSAPTDPGALPPGVAPPPLLVVAPVALIALAPEAARAANADQPFVGGNFPRAAPFRITGDSASVARATDCLAAAVLYEAGDDADGQRAVAQVVLNRARHPAFPGSVCGVVFQGSERRTGCQFTFTCDGALARRYSDAAWQRARGIAIDALTGAVYPGVGLATHYHTDWVRPYWSSSLDKLSQIGTHLFFRWRGYWGTPGAFSRGGATNEPLIGRMAALSPAHADAPDAAAFALAEPALSADIAAASARAVSAIIPRTARQLGDTIILTLDRQQTAESFPALAEAACGARAYCKVMAWTNPGLAPASEAMSDLARAAMSFSYLRDQSQGLERALWNCDEFTRENRVQCMRR